MHWLGRAVFSGAKGVRRYAVYAFIALFEVMILFSVSLKVEGRIRRRGYAPEWR